MGTFNKGSKGTMAHFVLINLGLHGHINPTLPMVRELVARGETVSEEFGPLIRATGASFFEYRSIFSRPVSGHIDSAGKTPMPIRLITDCLQALPDLKRAIEALNPDAILYDVMCLSGKILAEVLNKPAVRLSSTFVLNDKTSWKPKAAGNPTVLDFTKSGIAKICGDYGVKPFHFQDIFTIPTELNIIYTIRSFQPNESSFDERFEFVGASIDDQIKDQIDGQPNADSPKREALPFVYIALGTLANNRPDFFAMCKEALSAAPAKRSLIAVGNQVDVSQLTHVHDGLKIVRHAPQLKALQTADAFISHGGMNSLMEAIYFAVPLVFFPQTEEQMINAQLVSSLGAGIVLDEARLSTTIISQAIRELLENKSYRESAAILQAEVRSAGGFRRAADCIQAYLTRQTEQEAT